MKKYLFIKDGGAIIRCFHYLCQYPLLQQQNNLL
jgi:hypothetical protein